MIRLGLLAGVALAMSVAPAMATFVVETNFADSHKLFIDNANKDVDSFTGEFGGQHTKIFVDISTIGPVDTGNGFSNITPIKNGNLTLLTFSPENPNRFSDFSTRGQLVAAGTFSLTVQDNQGNGPQTFDFTGGKDDDFGRIGIISTDGETIKSVILAGNFEEVKQIELSQVAGGVPEPATWAMMLLGFATLGMAGYRRRRLAAA